MDEIDLERQAWLNRCLGDFDQIKIGMTRLEVEQGFVRNGGLQISTQSVYFHRECPWLAIDIKFEPDPNPPHPGDGSRDRVIEVGKPYLDRYFPG